MYRVNSRPEERRGGEEGRRGREEDKVLNGLVYMCMAYYTQTAHTLQQAHTHTHINTNKPLKLMNYNSKLIKQCTLKRTGPASLSLNEP